MRETLDYTGVSIVAEPMKSRHGCTAYTERTKRSHHLSDDREDGVGWSGRDSEGGREGEKFDVATDPLHPPYGSPCVGWYTEWLR